METETLTSYEQPQEKLILEDGMNAIQNNDEDSDSLPTNEVNEADSDTSAVSSSGKKDSEENCDELVSSSENKIESGEDLAKENAEESNDTLNRSINSPNVSSTHHEEEEEKNLGSDQENSSRSEEPKHDASNEEINECVQNTSDKSNEDTNDSVQIALDESNENTNECVHIALDESSEDVKESVENASDKSHEEINESVENTSDKSNEAIIESVQNASDKSNEEIDQSVQNASDKSSEEISESVQNALDKSNEEINENVSDKSNEDGGTIQNASDNDASCAENSEEGSKDSKTEGDPVSEENKEAVKDIEMENENSSDTKGTEDKSEPVPESTDLGKTPGEEVVSKDFPLLKETLLKLNNENEDKVGETETGTEEMEMDDDFDPSLLCPDIAMEIDEAPVITTTDNLPPDGNKSPLLYEPVYSTYVDEMTGAEVTFNLSPDEHQMRQDLYGQKNPIQFTKIHCTACNVHLGSALDGQGNRFVHPLLKVLICKDCFHFYTSGEFEKDEDGSELYCRWCGQGGQVMCCSACEMVFCKKCIRINFGRKKLVEIRDSDDWMCFRCNPIQLMELRVHCAEFMEYVRREISRAATLENATSFMTTDYTLCCVSQKKKLVDPNASEQPKKRRKKWVDPDYDPHSDMLESPKPTVSATEPTKNSPLKVVPILPKTDPLNVGVVTQISQGITTGTVFKVGNTTFRPRIPTLTQVRPMIQVSQAITSSGIRPQSSPGFIKIMPGGIRAAPSSRQPAQTFVSSSVRPQPQQRPIRPMNSQSSPMKHEWFEKTVRAAARVNSNLSYTLTQLNRAQASAGSVEALAVVHNKLQEILSTSINSLIQIRKNLRTEFIAGIKNIRFPPKPGQVRPQPSTSAQDDDVIFVSPMSSPVPPPLPVGTSNNLTPSVTLTNSPSTKKIPVPIIPTTSLQLIPGTSTSTVSNSEEKPKVFLRVKSLSALQNVPSECITIPDDPVPPLTPLMVAKASDVVTIDEDNPVKKKEAPAEKETVETGEENSATGEKGTARDCDKKSIKDEAVDERNANAENSEEDSSSCSTAKVLKPNLKNMLNIKICLQRSEIVDELVRKKFGLVNGNTSE